MAQARKGSRHPWARSQSKAHDNEPLGALASSLAWAFGIKRREPFGATTGQALHLEDAWTLREIENLNKGAESVFLVSRRNGLLGRNHDPTHHKILADPIQF